MRELGLASEAVDFRQKFVRVLGDGVRRGADGGAGNQR